MATFAELNVLYMRGTNESEALFARVMGGVLVVADLVFAENPGTNARRAWAAAALRNPTGSAQEMWGKLLAGGKALTTVNILALSDTAIQSGILSAVDLFAPVVAP